MSQGRFLIRLARALAAGLALFSAALPFTPAARAATSSLATSGTLRSVAVEFLSGTGGTLAGTRLVYREQRTEEATRVIVVSGTDDTALDVDPSLAVCPTTGLPIIAWSRQERSGYQVYLSYFDGSRWSPPRAVTSDSHGHHRPQALCGASGYVHLMWTSGSQSTAGTVFYEAILDPKGAIVLPARIVQVEPTSLITPTAPGSPTFNSTDLLFAFETPSKYGSVVVAFGGQDEPIPVNKRSDFSAVEESSTVESARIESVGTNVMVMFRSNARLFYSVQSAEGWSQLRSVSLVSLTEDQAEILIRSMASRFPTP